VFLVFDGQKTHLKDRERAKRAEHREKYQKAKEDSKKQDTESIIQFVVENPEAQVIVTETTAVAVETVA
jgi:5'-3' exonuclease